MDYILAILCLAGCVAIFWIIKKIAEEDIDE